MNDRIALDLAATTREAAHTLIGASSDYDPLLERIGDARFVLIGEASHGTHEFYRQRALITRRLIAKRGFTAVAVEADWPDADRVNRFVRGTGDGATAIDALAGFRALIAHLSRRRPRAKVVVWAHNSHLGDARATEMGQHGELNLGQFVRERYGHEAFNIGFSTNTGTVTAASDWDEPLERKRVRPALPESYETLFHAVVTSAERAVGAPADAEPQRDFLLLRDSGEIAELLSAPRLERAIGVIYRPETERISHYFHAQLSGQFDAVIHLDKTRAVEPLERKAGWKQGELPETFPTGQ